MAAEVEGKDGVGRLPVGVDSDANVAADVEAEELDVGCQQVCRECNRSFVPTRVCITSTQNAVYY